MTFEEAQRMFQNDRIRELAAAPAGLRFLKLRSLSRREYLSQLFANSNIVPQATSATALFREAYESPTITPDVIDRTTRVVYESERTIRRQREPDLINQLYRLQVFDWGGLHQNSLEKTIVDNYVKRIRDYDDLSDKIENELHNSLRGYVLCSWYNHWTSIIIEDVFRDHPRVIPAVGQVKKIDFFVDDIPFDLKVTYLPEGFVKSRRRLADFRPELTLLRQMARRLAIPLNTGLADAKLMEDLWAKLRDHPSRDAQSFVEELRNFRSDLVSQCRQDPSDLIKWLYENQGVRRFDAANRLFLVLIDNSNFFESWKLKRAKPLLESHICSYLDSFDRTAERLLEFTWDGTTHASISDAVFVVKP